MDGVVSIKGGRTLTNLQVRFADDIYGFTEKEEELACLVDRLGNACSASGINSNVGKTKLTTDRWHQH